MEGDEKVTARRPSWTGIDEPAKIGYHWVPYLIPHAVGRARYTRPGAVQTLPPEKVDMRGLKLVTKHMAIMWMHEGIRTTHPELVGKHIEVVEEPISD